MRVKTAGTSDEMVALMNEGGFDLVTASGDASLRLIAGKRVQEVNTELIPSWDKIDPRLQNAPWHTLEGRHYGVPYQWGSNVLMYNTEVFKEKPTSWKLILPKEGILNWVFAKLHLMWLMDCVLSLPVVGGTSLSVSYLGTFLVFLYIWMPYMVLPIQASLERVPASLIEASMDLGANGFQTFRHFWLLIMSPVAQKISRAPENKVTDFLGIRISSRFFG